MFIWFATPLRRLGSVIAASSLVVACSPRTAPKQSIRVGLDFTISGYDAPWFVALEKGYFAQEGLSVQVGRGFGSGETVKQLVAGNIDVGFAHPAPAIVSIAGGSHLRFIMGYFSHEMCSLYSFAEKGNVTSLANLVGKTWGGPAGDVCTILLRPLMESQGLNYNSIKIVNMDAPTRIPALVRGTIDVTGSFYDKDVLFEQAGKAAGLTLRTLRYDRFLDLYSNSVLTTDEFIKAHREAVAGLVKALIRGLRFSLDHPDSAAAIVRQRFPELDSVYVGASVGILSTAAVDSAAASHPLGYMDTTRLANTIRTVAKYWSIPAPPMPDSIFTNEFVVSAARQLASRKE